MAAGRRPPVFEPRAGMALRGAGATADLGCGGQLRPTSQFMVTLRRRLTGCAGSPRLWVNAGRWLWRSDGTPPLRNARRSALVLLERPASGSRALGLGLPPGNDAGDAGGNGGGQYPSGGGEQVGEPLLEASGVVGILLA